MARKRRRSPGEGSIRKRTYTRSDGSKRVRYAALVTAGWQGGNQKQVEGPLRKTEREALADLKKLNRQKDEGTLQAEDPTLAEYLAYWLREVTPKPELETNRRQLSQKTFKGYRGDVKNHILPDLGHLKLSKLEPVKLQAWQRGVEEGKSPAVARSAAATLSSALTRAAQWRLIQSNPYKDGAVLRPVLPQVEAGYWEPSEAAAFISHERVMAHPFYLAFYLTLNLGLRLGELRGLQYQDVTTLPNRQTGQDEPHIHVQRQAIDDRSVPSLSERLKTKHSNRFIPLPSATRKLLEPLGAPDAHIVTTGRGGVPVAGHLRAEFYKLCREASVRKIKFHGLRHTAGSLWLEAGVSLLRVSRWLGHSSMRTTEKIYIHLLREASHGDALSLEAMLSLGASPNATESQAETPANSE